MEGTRFFLRLLKGPVAGYEVSEEISLSVDGTVIGRPPPPNEPGPDLPDIRVRDDYVSRGHVRLNYNQQRRCLIVTERETGSQNGTFINDERIEPGIPYPLRDGDLLALAKVDDDYEVIFRFREMGATLAGRISRDETSHEALVVDLKARRVWASDREITLRRKEFDLLAFLYRNRGVACSRDEIARQVWQEEGGIVSEDTIETNIHRVREMIEPEPSKPRYIITLPRYGYRLDV
jgi:DNA-binding winged helix-turn-helix (wHTH) protein